ncbi:hypothetical protein BAUCODRAFT_409140 [Baudoinia panamericana UAMH 10762]|uniref:Uncharacterized protein n=1 Tax=Baudoinia panamericana (strain UAMH 10762) TaxID=717646 RepID=M2MMP9_BAUPA|nr:uncharacterized protein BAUCODRAFT_409140 [Baudoinia panamericana UAMH 10762]EMC97966.1 hypothetical protein BAUCODRAFT_409140 [Baudoinia panamericana UAMH 10762]
MLLCKFLAAAHHHEARIDPVSTLSVRKTFASLHVTRVNSRSNCTTHASQNSQLLRLVNSVINLPSAIAVQPQQRAAHPPQRPVDSPCGPSLGSAPGARGCCADVRGEQGTRLRRADCHLVSERGHAPKSRSDRSTRSGYVSEVEVGDG